VLNSAFVSPGSNFLKNYLQSYQDSGESGSFMDRPDLIAANVLIPDIKPGQFGGNVRKNYPQLPVQREGDVGGNNPYRALGIFGGLGADPTDIQERGYIRGMMNFVPGGIPASPGFNFDETLKKYPEQMQGVPRGNMPVYGSPY
jgi:hypothetical protein